MSATKIIGWILSVLLAALLCFSAAMKFMEWEGKAEAFAKSGFTEELMFQIGIVEVTITLLFLIPRSAFIAEILLTGYLGGATVTHLRLDEPIFAPILIGVVIWVALGLRDPRIFTLALGNKAPPTQS